jgi:CHAD domain-containing protein
LDNDVVRKLSRRLRKLTRRLGPVRDLDVLLLLTNDLRGSRRHSDSALSRIEQSVRRDRDAAQRRLVHKHVYVDLRRAARKLEVLLGELEDRDRGDSRGRGWRWAIDARVARRASMLMDAAREAGSMYVPDRLHGIRLAMKKLRYAIELSSEAAGGRGTPDVRTLKRGQDLLGRLRDLQVLMDRVRREQASLPATDLSGSRDFDALVMALEHRCRRLHARYIRERSGLMALCDRLSSRAAVAAARRAG